MTYRMLDASLNRANEGLRTLEELARFGLNQRAITSDLKLLRHDLATSMQPVSRQRLLQSRDTEGDVGTDIGTQTEYDRTDLAAVLQAASSRVQQSLRVIEECCKVIESSVSPHIEQIRYRVYTVCAALESHWPRRELTARLEQAQLYVLLDAGGSETEFRSIIAQVCQGGVDVIQLRDRSVDDRTLIARGRVGTELARQQGVLFIMNDRADLALAADCDGVHVGQDELPVRVARQIVGPDRVVGVSTHAVDEALAAVADGADYIGCGPVFPSGTKQFETFVGTDLLKQLADQIAIPAFAIGGIGEDNIVEVMKSGFHRIAVSGAVKNSSDPADAAKRLKAILSAHVNGGDEI